MIKVKLDLMHYTGKDLVKSFYFVIHLSDIILDGSMLLTNLTISPRPGQNTNVTDERRIGRC